MKYFSLMFRIIWVKSMSSSEWKTKAIHVQDFKNVSSIFLLKKDFKFYIYMIFCLFEQR